MFFFPIKPVSNSWKNYVLEGKKSLGYKCILNCFNQLLSITCKQRWFLIIKNPRCSKNCFGCGSSFLKDYFATKENAYGIGRHIWSFFCSLYFIFLQRIAHLFFKFKIIINWSTFTCFLNAIISLIVLYMINTLAWDLDLNSKLDCYNKEYNTWLEELSDQILCYQ